MATGVYGYWILFGIVFVSVDTLVELAGLQYSSTLIILKCRLPLPSLQTDIFFSKGDDIWTKFTFFAHIDTLQVPLQPSSCDMVFL